jgi:hypothetical protein
VRGVGECFHTHEKAKAIPTEILGGNVRDLVLRPVTHFPHKKIQKKPLIFIFASSFGPVKMNIVV